MGDTIIRTFSILERIVVGETQLVGGEEKGLESFSILERIVVGETPLWRARDAADEHLSVSSNGSLWVKPTSSYAPGWAILTFSILERIVVGETISSSGG